jgi:hypothetical protein
MDKSRVGGVGEGAAVPSARELVNDLDLRVPRVASDDAGARKSLDIEAELLCQLGPFADAHRAPTLHKDRECNWIGVARNG